RAMARDIIGAGSFIETYLSASVTTCAGRDPKGLYAKALAGEVPAFTGISAPYETPLNPEIVIDTASLTVSDSAARVFSYLRQHSL
ncbi:adenylyl-sulfate kinase, partial [Pseudomonas sp. SIMBA_077]